LLKRGRDTARSAARNSIFVDTSAWIAFFSARDQHHAEADRMFRRAADKGRILLTTNLVLAEVHRLLLYRAGIEAAAAALDRIEASALTKTQFPGPSHHQAGLLWLKKLRQHPISYTDAVSFAVMEEIDCEEAMSFDQHFRIAGFAYFEAPPCP
jgi:predicted nucleic acid-binding protein